MQAIALTEDLEVVPRSLTSAWLSKFAWPGDPELIPRSPWAENRKEVGGWGNRINE